MRRSRTTNEVQVESHRGHTILVNTFTSQFCVQELADVAPVPSVREAKSAIDRHIAGLNKGVRRKVLVFSDMYAGDEPRKLREGELTSWTRVRSYGNRLTGIVMVGRDRRETPASSIFEDTPRNRELMQQVIELDKARIKAANDAEKIVEEKLEQASIPQHFRNGDDPE